MKKIYSQAYPQISLNEICPNSGVFFLYFYFLGGTRIWTQGFTITRQEFYYLSHVPSPLYSGHFGDRISIFAQDDLHHDYTSCHYWGDRCTPLCSAFFREMGSHKRLCPGWPGTVSFTISAACIAEMTGACLCIQLWLRWGLTGMPRMVGLPISASQVARIISVSTWLPEVFWIPSLDPGLQYTCPFKL
jgi:hypothetical protein